MSKGGGTLWRFFYGPPPLQTELDAPLIAWALSLGCSILTVLNCAVLSLTHHSKVIRVIKKICCWHSAQR